jgi:ribosomal protein S28E/S33
MEKIKCEYLGPEDSMISSQSIVGIFKKGDIVMITEQELEEMSAKFKRCVSEKKGEK